MKVKECYQTIKTALEMYRESADLIAQSYTDRKQEIYNRYLKAKTSGKYSDAYLNDMQHQNPSMMT